jgi:hypothetical protein
MGQYMHHMNDAFFDRCTPPQISKPTQAGNRRTAQEAAELLLCILQEDAAQDSGETSGTDQSGNIQKMRRKIQGIGIVGLFETFLFENGDLVSK